MRRSHFQPSAPQVLVLGFLALAAGAALGQDLEGDIQKARAELEAMITDPVYEGKSMAGLVDLVTSGEIGKDANVLYAHLGGQPALSAYAGLFTER